MAELIPYLGAKRSLGTLHQIIGRMPPHDVSIETHLGTGAVINAKPPSARDIGIDIDEATLATFTYREGTEIHHGAFMEILAGMDLSKMGRVFIYMDPPYLETTRTSNKRYRFEYTEDDHRRMIEWANEVPDNVSVMISGYPSDFYDWQLSDWRTHEFQAMTRGGVRTEKLWMNYDEPMPFWHTQAGVNAEDRRRIKRKAARWRKNFNNMPMMEQIAILAALSSPEEI